MKFSTILCGILLMGIFNSSLPGGQVFTWTDENGNLHVTDTPPPPRAKVKDTLEYQEKTVEEIQALQNRRQRRDLEREQDAKGNRVDDAKKRAREADQAAQKATEDADQITQEVEAYVRRLGSTKEKRKQFRKKIQREIQRAEDAQERARQAVEDARQANEEARLVEEEFNAQQQ
ncbi:MAG: DUF4124 domain-containing protein [Desulfobacterales bacterium]|nr:DUF4124 domain-containing protein [Desulfobacterales bacterium]